MKQTIHDPKESAVMIDGVHKAFRHGTERVLRGVDMRIPKGELVYILGNSGAGKSVLLKHILGLVKPDRGKVWIDGQDLGSFSSTGLEELRLKFGMLFQNSALFDDMSVFENVAFPLRQHTRLKENEIKVRVGDALTSLGMKAGWSKFPNELSGGMRKRVGLARAIIRQPSILLYDEPTTGLDPVIRATVDEMIEKLKRELKLTSIVISHDIPSALLLADFIAFLHEGKIVFFGTPDEFRKSEHAAIREFLAAERHSADAFYGKH